LVSARLGTTKEFIKSFAKYKNMKIKLSKSQWCQIGKTAGWTYMVCSYCGNPIDNPRGQTDPFCLDKKCKVHDPHTPDDDLGISDGICKECMDKEIPFGNESKFPYNINKGNTPKDAIIRYIEEATGRKQLTQEELNEIFQKNITSSLKLINYKNY
jgi:hypothetical protein